MRPDETTGSCDDRSFGRVGADPDAGPCSPAHESDAGSFANDDLVHAETHRLRRLAARLLANEHDREDLLQDVWLESVARPPRNRGGAQSWLRVVATHAASRLGRRARSRAARERLAAKPERERSVLESLEHEAARAELRRWVDGLKGPYREVVRLHYLEDVEMREIAQRLQHSEATIRSQLKRGLDQLRARHDITRAGDARSGRKRASAWLPWFFRRDAGTRSASFPRFSFAAGAVAAGILGVSLVLFSLLRDRSDDALGSLASPAPALASLTSQATALELAQDDSALASRAASSLDAPVSQAALTPTSVPAFVVSGRTLDVYGRPVANAEIWASLNADYAPGRSIAHSDKDGLYRSSELREDLWVWAEDLDNGLTGRTRVHSPRTEDAVQCDLRFGANLGHVSGIVRDSSGAPIAGAQVSSLLLQSARMSIGWNGEELAMYASSAGTTDAQGRFAISRIQSPRVDLLVTAEGNAPYATWFEPSSRDELALVVPEASTLEVHVRKPDGTPAAGIAVALEHPDPLPSSTGETDAQGAYRFERVAPGPFTWIARAPAGELPLSIVRHGRLLPGQTLTLEPIALSPEWTIRGIAMCGSRALEDWSVSLDDNTDALSPCANRTTRTAADGRFAFSGCVGTNYTLRLSPAAEWTGIPYTSVGGIAPGGPDAWLVFDERSAPSAFVRGTLADVEIPSGQAITVTATRVATPTAYDDVVYAQFDRATNRFEVGPLPPGDYELHATHSALGRWKIGDVSVHPGTDVELGRLSIPRTGALLVRWSQNWGAIDENFCLVLDGQGVQLYGRRDKSGARFEVDEAARTIKIPGLLAGSYSMLVQGQRIASELRSVRIEEDEESTVDLALREGAPVDVRVKSPRVLATRESLVVRIESESETFAFSVYERPKVLNLDAVAQFRPMLGYGMNLIEVSTSGGLRGELALEIRANELPGVVTVELR